MADAKPILLMAEDEKDLADSLCTFAQRWGFDVRVFDNGQQTLEELDRIGHPVVLVTDFGLKKGLDGNNLTGFEINEAVKAKYPDMPVIMLTGDGSLWQRANDAGMGFLVKGQFTHDDLKNVLDAAQRKLDGGRTPMDHGTRPPQNGQRGLFD